MHYIHKICFSLFIPKMYWVQIWKARYNCKVPPEYISTFEMAGNYHTLDFHIFLRFPNFFFFVISCHYWWRTLVTSVSWSGKFTSVRSICAQHIAAFYKLFSPFPTKITNIKFTGIWTEYSFPLIFPLQ